MDCRLAASKPSPDPYILMLFMDIIFINVYTYVCIGLCIIHAYTSNNMLILYCAYQYATIMK